MHFLFSRSTSVVFGVPGLIKQHLSQRFLILRMYLIATCRDIRVSVCRQNDRIQSAYTTHTYRHKHTLTRWKAVENGAEARRAREIIIEAVRLDTAARYFFHGFK